jgi:hypothetical protein
MQVVRTTIQSQLHSRFVTDEGNIRKSVLLVLFNGVPSSANTTLPGFMNDFQTFWEERNASRGHASEIGLLVRRKPGFVCLLSSMLFAALKCAPRSWMQIIMGNCPDLTAGDMYVATVVSTTPTSFLRRPSLYSLAAYLILQSPLVMEEEFSDFPDFIGMASRIALGMALHRHLPEHDLSVAELETRRRLWWYVIHLDVMASASSGLSPLFIDEKMANIEMISKFDQRTDVDGREGHKGKHKIATQLHKFNACTRAQSIYVISLLPGGMK